MTKDTELMPELWEDSEVERMVNSLYEECKEVDCAACPLRNEVEEDVCKNELIQDLWRKWRNVHKDDY